MKKAKKFTKRYFDELFQETKKQMRTAEQLDNESEWRTAHRETSIQTAQDFLHHVTQASECLITLLNDQSCTTNLINIDIAELNQTIGILVQHLTSPQEKQNDS